VLSTIATLPTHAQPTSAVFSSACFRHCVTDSAAFWNVNVEITARGKKPEFISLRDAVANWSAPLLARAHQATERDTE
jgi:hypothetical protein